MLRVLAICLCFSLMAGCAPGPATRTMPTTIPTTKRLTVVEGPLNVGGNDLYIVKDNETGSEFVFVDGPESVAVTPIQPKAVPK